MIPTFLCVKLLDFLKAGLFPALGFPPVEGLLESPQPSNDKLCFLHLVVVSVSVSYWLPFSGQTDARLFRAAFAQGEQFPDNLLCLA